MARLTDSVVDEAERPTGDSEDTLTRPVQIPIGVRWKRAAEKAGNAAVCRDISEAQLNPGDFVGDYQLVSRLAKGGMAEVWMAWRKLEHRREVVAVKSLLPHLVAEPEFVSMFLDEARLLSRIHHANVVGIRDVSTTEEGYPFVALEWVDGDSLTALLQVLARKQKPLPMAIAMRIVGEVCLGLHMAHEMHDDQGQPLGVVHRDVSPSNIMLSAAGEVKVIDFGVAKAATRLAEHTRTGVLKGKVAYMAPEQALQRPIDRRADVWAVGVVMYQLLAGKLPYQGSMADVLRLVKQASPSRELPAGTPGVVREIVNTALSAEPDKRFATAAEMRRMVQYAYAEVCAPVPRDQFARFVMTHLGPRISARRMEVARALVAQ